MLHTVGVSVRGRRSSDLAQAWALAECEDGERDARTVVLGPSQGVTIPRGIVHRPHAIGRTVVLMVEPATVVPTGND